MPAHAFGEYIRRKRLELRKNDPRFSLRRLAGRLGIRPAYLRRLERGAAPGLSEGRILALARELGENPDVLLARAGRIAADVRDAILQRPDLLAGLVRDFSGLPDQDAAACRNYRSLIASLRETQRLARVGSFDRNLVTGEDFWSEEFFHIFGLPENGPAPTFEAFLALVHPEDRENVQAMRRKALAGQGLLHYTYRFRRSDGTWRHAKAVARGECDAGGRPLRVYGTVQDVTAERQAMEDLRSIARFPEENPHPVLRVTRDGVLAYANAASGPLLASLGVAVGQYVAEPLQTAVRQALEAGRAQDIELEVADRWLTLTVTPLPRAGYANLYGMDITARRQAESALAEAHAALEAAVARRTRELAEANQALTRKLNEAAILECRLGFEQVLLSALMRSTVDYISFKDTTGRFLRVNKAYAEAFGGAVGGDPDHVAGLRLEDLFDPETARAIRAENEAVACDGAPLTDQEARRFTAMDGSDRFLLVTRLPLRDASGTVIGTCSISRDVTAWRRTEQALAETEARYERLVDDAVLGIFRATASGRLLAANPAMARLFGYASPDEMLALAGDNTAQLYVDPARRAEVVRRLTLDNGLLSFENPYRRKDGSVFIGNLHARLAAPEGGEAVVEGFVEDITRRKKVENELVASEERLKTHLRNFPLPTLTFRLRDRELVLADANKAAEALFRGRIGRSLEASAGAIFDASPDVYLALWSAFEGRRTERRRLTFRPPGLLEPGLFDMTFVFAAPDTVMLHAEEVTALTQTREALRRTSDQLKGILDHVPCAIYFKDTAGRCIMVNQALEELFDLPADQIVGQAPGHVHDPAVAERIAQEDRMVLASGRAVTYEEDIVAQGKLRRFLTTKVPLTDATGAPYAICGMSLDITPVKNLERDVKAERDTLLAVLQNVPYAACLLSPQGKVLFLNRSFEALLGYSLKDIPGNDAWFERAYPDPDMRERVRREWEASLGTDTRRTFPVCCGDGRTRLLDFQVTNLPDGRILLTMAEAGAWPGGETLPS